MTRELADELDSEVDSELDRESGSKNVERVVSLLLCS